MVCSKFFWNFFRKIEICNKILKHVTCFYGAKHVTCFHQIPFFPTAEDKNKFSNVLPDRFGYYGAIIIQNITILTWVVKKKFSSRSGNKWSPPLRKMMFLPRLPPNPTLRRYPRLHFINKLTLSTVTFRQHLWQ